MIDIEVLGILSVTGIVSHLSLSLLSLWHGSSGLSSSPSSELKFSNRDLNDALGNFELIRVNKKNNKRIYFKRI